MTTKNFTYTTYITKSELFSREDWDITVSGTFLLAFRDMCRRVEVENYVMDLTSLKINTEWGECEGVDGPTFNLYMNVMASNYEVDTDSLEW